MPTGRGWVCWSCMQLVLEGSTHRRRLGIISDLPLDKGIKRQRSEASNGPRHPHLFLCLSRFLIHLQVLTSTTGEVQIDKYTSLQVKCEVKQLSFSAHADARGILHTIQTCKPKHVMLVHGERSKMAFLQQKIRHPPQRTRRGYDRRNTGTVAANPLLGEQPPSESWFS